MVSWHTNVFRRPILQQNQEHFCNDLTWLQGSDPPRRWLYVLRKHLPQTPDSHQYLKEMTGLRWSTCSAANTALLSLSFRVANTGKWSESTLKLHCWSILLQNESMWPISFRICLELFKCYKALNMSEMPKIVHPNPFLTLHLKTPKDIAIKSGKDMSRTELYHHAIFPTNRLHCHRDICPRTKRKIDIQSTNDTPINYCGMVGN